MSKTERSDFGAHRNQERNVSQDQTEKNIRKRDEIVLISDVQLSLVVLAITGVINFVCIKRFSFFVLRFEDDFRQKKVSEIGTKVSQFRTNADNQTVCERNKNFLSEILNSSDFCALL